MWTFIQSQKLALGLLAAGSVFGFVAGATKGKRYDSLANEANAKAPFEIDSMTIAANGNVQRIQILRTKATLPNGEVISRDHEIECVLDSDREKYERITLHGNVGSNKLSVFGIIVPQWVVANRE